MNAAQYILIAAVRTYQWVLSPAKASLFGPLGRCRFSPSCSDYALGSVREHGAVRGAWLAAKRLARCHPWGGCGWDPVPEKLPEHLTTCSCRAEQGSSKRISSRHDHRVAATAGFSGTGSA